MFDDILGPREEKEIPKTNKEILKKKGINLKNPIGPIQGAKDANVNGETCEGCGNHIDECDCPEDYNDECTPSDCEGCNEGSCDPWGDI